ncbi:MAG TPA: carboxypeptidase regulatory-like domain-containing protein [Terracidiphilus sp.]|nr:carboxypeptidase regulatory-like domain-containing protein [Terracidiphilus sp.]
MSRFTFRSAAVLGIVFCLSVAFNLPGFAQQTLGTINGTVVDPSGAALPGASITVTNSATNYVARTTTQSTGFYQIFNLPIGTYVVRVSLTGFQTAELPNIPVQEARATTANVSLKVGSTSTSIIVNSVPLLNATDTTNGYTLDSAQIAITPLATGSFTQAAVLSPGVNAELLPNLDTNSGLGNQSIWANGQRATSNTFQVDGVDSTNLFNGMTSSGDASQRYNFNIGSAPTAGGSFSVGTSVYGSNGNSLPSPPPEFIQELRVNASMYDAQQGATAGAQIDVNTQTGSNTWHGQVYGTYANNLMNASPFFFNQSYQLSQVGVGYFPQSLVNPWLRRFTSGATFGGPIKKNRLFLFAGYERTVNEDRATGLADLNVPNGLTDDRSTAGLEAADISWGGSGNVPIDPVAAAILNTKLADGQYLIPSAQSSNPYQFGQPNGVLSGIARMAAHQAVVSVDYDTNHNDRVSAKYYYQNAPVTRPFGFSSTAGFPVTAHNGAQVFSLGNTTSIGQRLNWEQRLGFVREGTFSDYKQEFSGNLGVAAAQPDNLVANLIPGLEINNFANSDQYSPSLYVGPAGVPGAFVDMGYYQSRLNPSTNVIFTAGQHTIMAGGGYSYTQLNITNNRTGHAQVRISNFENFLQGVVRSSSVVQSIDPNTGRNNADRYYRTNEYNWYVQDKWQAKNNLSITAGVRFDYHGGMTEKYGDMFNFNPAAYDVTGDTTNGFTVNNSGFVIAGNNKQHPTSGVSASTLKGRQWGVSPRVGFAWSPAMNHGNVVISGGAGMYFDRGELFSYLSQPAGGSIGGPFGVTESSPLVSVANGNTDQESGLTLENPMGNLAFTPASGGGEYVAPSSDPGVINQALQAQLNQMTGSPGPDSYFAQFGKNCSGWQSQEGYFLCTTPLNFGVYDMNNVLPYTINYTLTMQWQPRNDVAVTIGYTGNRGRHAVIPIPINEPKIATPQNPVWGETATYGVEVMNQNSENCGYDYCPISVEPWNTFDAGNTDFRTPYVGFSPNAADFKTVGVSAYDALQAHIDKRLSHNFQVGASYTWSHALDEQSDIGLFFTGDDPKHLRDSWASSDFDRTHVFSANFQVNTPDLVKEHNAASYVANGWHLTGIGTVQSGEPWSLYEFYGAVGSINFGNFPTLMNPVLGIKDPQHPQTALTGNSGKLRTKGGDYIPYLDPSQVDIRYVTPGTNGVPVATGSDPQDIYETSFNVGQRNIFRQAAQKRLDMSVRKDVRITEKMKLQLEFNIFNVTNTTSNDIPQDQAQIRQNNGCSATAIADFDGYNNCNIYRGYLGYGQVVTSNDPTDQQSALSNYDQVPTKNGTGKGLTMPLTLVNGQGYCTPDLFITNQSACPNNAANFGSVTGTIGGNRAVTMGMHLTF